MATLQAAGTPSLWSPVTWCGTNFYSDTAKNFWRWDSILGLSLSETVFVRALQRNRTNRTFIMENLSQELPHVVMGAEKSHDLWSVGWRPGKPMT